MRRRFAFLIVPFTSTVLLMGCGYPGWTVFAQSYYGADVIVRVSYDADSRAVRVPAGQDIETVVRLPDPPSAAHVEVLDWLTCTELGSADLPSREVLVSFGDPNGSGRFGTIEVDPIDEPSEGPLPPALDPCLGR